MSVQINQTTTVRHEYRVPNPTAFADLKEAVGLAEKTAAGKGISADSIGAGADGKGIYLHFNEVVGSASPPGIDAKNQVLRQ